MGNSVGNAAASVGNPPAGPLTQAAYARRCGVNPSTVTRWIQNGRIPVRPDGLIDPEAADRARALTESPLPHHQARKAQFDEARQAAPAAPSPPSPDLPPLEKLGAALKLETYKLQKAKAEAANLELDRVAGLLVERAEVDYLLRDVAAILHSTLEGMSAQLAPSLAAHRGDVAAIQSEMDAYLRDTLTQIAEHIERKSAQHLAADPTPP